MFVQKIIDNSGLAIQCPLCIHSNVNKQNVKPKEGGKVSCKINVYTNNHIYIYNGYIMFKSSLILNMMKCYGH